MARLSRRSASQDHPRCGCVGQTHTSCRNPDDGNPRNAMDGQASQSKTPFEVNFEGRFSIAACRTNYSALSGIFRYRTPLCSAGGSALCPRRA